jgi:hypothetical protein
MRGYPVEPWSIVPLRGTAVDTLRTRNSAHPARSPITSFSPLRIRVLKPGTDSRFSVAFRHSRSRSSNTAALAIAVLAVAEAVRH